MVPVSLEPRSPSSSPPALASLLGTCHRPDGSCSEQLPGAAAGVLEPRVPQIMPPAPRLQPDPRVAPPGCACRPGAGAHPPRAQLQPIAAASGPCWVEQDRGGPRHAESVTGSGVQTTGGVPAPALLRVMGASTVLLMHRGPQIPPAQPGSSAQGWELCGAAWEPHSSRLSPGGLCWAGAAGVWVCHAHHQGFSLVGAGAG